VHILIFDGDPDRRDELASYFDQEHYRITAVVDHEQFRAVLDTEPVHLVLVDIAAPADSGFDLAGELRHRSDVGVILLGNRDDLIDRVAGLEAGADDFISPPFHMRELLARVHSVLRRTDEESLGPLRGSRRRGRSGDIAVFEDWTLDLRSRRLQNASGQEVELSPGEFELLNTLIENSGRPVSRDELARGSRESQTGGSGRSVDVQIGRLRQKIEPNPKHPSIIRTARGIGYMFVGRQTGGGV